MFEDGKIGRPEAVTAIQCPPDPHLHVKEIERDGVDAEVIFGIFGGSSNMQDVEAVNHMLEIYNGWLVDSGKPHPDSMIGLRCIPYGVPDLAAQEVYLCAKMGVEMGGTVVLLGYEADVESGGRRATAVAFSHVPDHGTAGARNDLGPGAARGDVHRRFGVPVRRHRAEADQYE